MSDLIIASMEGFQPKHVEAIRSDCIVCVIKTPDVRVKVFQIAFGSDGSLFVTFPYFRHRTGILSATAIPAGHNKTDINLEQGGKVTSHKVKYSHHPSGQALFSQTGRIKSTIRRQSIPLDEQEGHIFSLIFQGLHAFDGAHPLKDSLSSPKRAVIEFSLDSVEALKIVGRWYDVNKLRHSVPNASIGPISSMVDPTGAITVGIFTASPHQNTKYVLAINCVQIPRLNCEPEVFTFCGGFDAPEIMTDPTKQGGFLAFIYPISEVENLRDKIGSVDYIPVPGSGELTPLLSLTPALH